MIYQSEDKEKSRSMKNKKIKIYAGLSLSQSELAALLPEAEFHQPIERYDLLKDIDLGYNVVGIIDGKFQQSLAVNSSEILDAIRCGLKMYGSSSMGALRAAEMAHFGMIGCGAIYEFVKKSPIFQDDYLGQSFNSENLAASSVPYIDLHFELERKVASGAISGHHGEMMRHAYSEIFYPQRNQQALKFALKEKSATDSNLEKAIEILFQNFQSQKNIDAVKMVQQIKDDLIFIEQKNQELWSRQLKCRFEQDFYK